MSDLPTRDDLRLARMLLPASLLRELDELVLEGRGGYDTRQEFILEAIQNQILEVKYGAAENGQRRLVLEAEEQAVHKRAASRSSQAPAVKKGAEVASAPPAIANGEAVEPVRELSETELHLNLRGTVLDEGLAVVKEEPVLGLHNRDYPSLWSAVVLADATREGLVPFSTFLSDATQEAWRYAESLRDLEQQTKVKLRALYPTNFAKPQSAEEGFRAFAIGAAAKTPRDDGKIDASGPLSSWGVCQLVRDDHGQLMIGLTTSGYELLESLDGLSLRWPHEPHHAERFLAFLREHARWDWERVPAAHGSGGRRANAG